MIIYIYIYIYILSIYSYKYTQHVYLNCDVNCKLILKYFNLIHYFKYLTLYESKIIIIYTIDYK